MGYKDQWDLLTGDPRWNQLDPALQKRITRQFAKKILAPEVGGLKSDEARAFIQDNIIGQPAPQARGGNVFSGAAQQFDNTLTGLAARGIKGAVTGDAGRLVQQDLAIANNPWSIGAEAVGGMAADILDPLGLAIDYATGKVGSRVLRGVATRALEKGADATAKRVAAVAHPTVLSGLSGGIQGGLSTGMQGGNAGEIARDAAVGAGLGGLVGHYTNPRRTPPATAPAAAAAPAAAINPNMEIPTAGAGNIDVYRKLPIERLVELAHRVAAKGDQGAAAVARKQIISQVMAERQDEIARLTNRGYAAEEAFLGQDAPPATAVPEAGQAPKISPLDSILSRAQQGVAENQVGSVERIDFANPERLSLPAAGQSSAPIEVPAIPGVPNQPIAPVYGGPGTTLASLTESGQVAQATDAELLTLLRNASPAELDAARANYATANRRVAGVIEQVLQERAQSKVPARAEVMPNFTNADGSPVAKQGLGPMELPASQQRLAAANAQTGQTISNANRPSLPPGNPDAPYARTDFGRQVQHPTTQALPPGQPAPAALPAGEVSARPALKPGGSDAAIPAGGAIGQPGFVPALEGQIPQRPVEALKKLSDQELRDTHQAKLKQLRAVEAKKSAPATRTQNGMRVKHADPAKYDKTIERLQGDLAAIEQEMMYRDGTSTPPRGAEPRPSNAIGPEAAPPVADSPRDIKLYGSFPGGPQLGAAVEKALGKLDEKVQAFGESNIKAEQARIQAAKATKAALTAPKQPSGEKYAANINLNRVDAPGSVKALIESTAESYKGSIDEARRGTITHEETQRMADDLGMTVEDLLKRRKGQAFNAEQAKAARDILASSADNLAKLAKQVEDGDNSDEMLAKLLDAMEIHGAIQDQVTGVAAEAGRALSQFNIAAKAGREKIEAINGILDKFGGRDRADDLAKMLAKAGRNPATLNKTVADLRKPRAADIFSELYINSILSGPKTHLTNIVGNTITILTRTAETAGAAVAGQVIKGAKSIAGQEYTPSVQMGEAFGALRGAADALGIVAEYIRKGEHLPGMGTAPETDMPGAISAARLGMDPTSAKGKAVDATGNFVRIPTRALSAADRVFKMIHYRMELNQLAYRKAASEGLKGDAFNERVAQLLAAPEDGMMDAARAAADLHTFNQSANGKSVLSTVARSMLSAKAKHPVLNLLIPFVRTPLNVLRYAGERTPLGLLKPEIRDAIKAGGPEGELAVSRMVLGSALGLAMASIAAQGGITGGGPSDPRQRQLLRATGWQPYSFKIGDKYVSYQRFAPFGMIMGMAADLTETGGEADEHKAGKLVKAIASNLTNQTFLKGISDFMAVMNDPDQHAAKYVSTLVGPVVPAALSQVAEAADPTNREVKDVVAGVAARIPGARESIPARLDFAGREQKRPDNGFLMNLLNPAYVSTETNDPVAKELARLKIYFDVPKSTEKGKPMAEDAYQRLVKEGGKDVYAALEALVNSTSYKNAADDPDKQERMIRRVYDRARERARRIY